MRDEPDTKKDSAPPVIGSVSWHVIDVRPLPGHRLTVRFADGTSGEVDVSRLIFGRKPGVFDRLRDPTRFAQVGIQHGAVTWPGDLDLAPDAMYDGIRLNGSWSPE